MRPEVTQAEDGGCTVQEIVDDEEPTIMDVDEGNGARPEKVEIESNLPEAQQEEIFQNDFCTAFNDRRLSEPATNNIIGEEDEPDSPSVRLSEYDNMASEKGLEVIDEEHSSSKSEGSKSGNSSSSSGSCASKSYHSSEAYHDGSDTPPPTPDPPSESSSDSMSKAAPELPKPECVGKPPSQSKNPILHITAQSLLKAAYDLKEQGNALYKKKEYQRAIAKYRLVQMYTRAVKPPTLPELQIAKTEEEIKEDKERAKEAGSTGDPRDPRNDPNTPRSMADIERMTKWMEIPKLWKELPEKRSQLVIEPSETDMKVCTQIQGDAFLNLSICYYHLKEWKKSSDFAKESAIANPTIKAFFR